MDDMTRRLLSTTDASVWAHEFVTKFPGPDEGLMISWFASAIETGRSAGYQQGRRECEDPHDA